MQPQVTQTIEHYKDDARYFEQHRDELTAKYPEQWVAIFNKEIVATANSLEQLLPQLQEKRLPRSKVFVEHISRKDDLLILPQV